RPVGARAIRREVAELRREEGQAGPAEDLLDLLGHLARQELGGEDGLLAQGSYQRLPVGVGDRADPDVDLVGLGSRPLDPGADTPLLDRDREHLTAPRVRPSPRQPGADLEPLQNPDPALRPPALAEGAALRLRPDPPLGRAGARRRVIPVI